MIEGRQLKLADGRNFIVDSEGRIYQDSTHIPEWQLTPEELKEIVPDRYAEKFGRDVVVCPFSGCEEGIELYNKRSVRMHFFNKHKLWFEKFGDRFKEIDAGPDVRAFVRETENQVAS